MTELTWTKLLEMANLLQKGLSEAGQMASSSNRLHNDPYAEWLRGLTDSQAEDHMKVVDDERLLQAYLILELQVLKNERKPAVLARVCLDFMTHPRDSLLRSIGVSGIGAWLAGTRDRNISRELARMIRDPEEDEAIRQDAYSSLLTINRGADAAIMARLEKNHGVVDESVLNSSLDIDWQFVDSFLNSDD